MSSGATNSVLHSCNLCPFLHCTKRVNPVQVAFWGTFNCSACIFMKVCCSVNSLFLITFPPLSSTTREEKRESLGSRFVHHASRDSITHDGTTY